MYWYNIKSLKIEIAPDPRGMPIIRTRINGKVTSGSNDPRYAQSDPCEEMGFERDLDAFLPHEDQVERYFDEAKNAFRRFLQENRPKPMDISA